MEIDGREETFDKLIICTGLVAKAKPIETEIPLLRNIDEDFDAKRADARKILSPPLITTLLVIIKLLEKPLRWAFVYLSK